MHSLCKRGRIIEGRAGVIAAIIAVVTFRSSIIFVNGWSCCASLFFQSETQKIEKTKPVQERPATATRGGGWMPVKASKGPSADVKDTLLPNGWSVPIRAGISDLTVSGAGVCLVSSAEARKAILELKSEKALAILAPANINNVGEELHVMVEGAGGRWQVRRRFLFQLGAIPVTYMEDKPKREFKPDSVKVVLSISKSCTDADTWSHACKNATELTKQWLRQRAKVEFLDVRPPTRQAGVEDVLQIVVFVPASGFTILLRASGKDGVITRPFFESDADKNMYRCVPLDTGISVQAALRQADFLGDQAFGVIATSRGFGIRVKAESFEEVLKTMRPDDFQSFVGKKLEISGLPLAMGKESLQCFLGNWQVHPLYSFRQGFRRTWLVRAAGEPLEKTIAHEYGMAVINESIPRQNAVPIERLQVPRAERIPALSRRVQPGDAHAPRSWAAVVADPGGGRVQPKPNRREGGMGAAAATQVAVPAAAPNAEAAPKTAASKATVPPIPGSQDLMQMMAAAIEAALQPMRNQLEATIIPMQRTIESLQAEFVALREFQAGDGDETMEQLALRDAKRGSETDRMQTRATRLRIVSQA